MKRYYSVRSATVAVNRNESLIDMIDQSPLTHDVFCAPHRTANAHAITPGSHTPAALPYSDNEKAAADGDTPDETTPLSNHCGNHVDEQQPPPPPVSPDRVCCPFSEWSETA